MKNYYKKIINNSCYVINGDSLFYYNMDMDSCQYYNIHSESSDKFNQYYLTTKDTTKDTIIDCIINIKIKNDSEYTESLTQNAKPGQYNILQCNKIKIYNKFLFFTNKLKTITNKSESDYLVAFNTILACETMKLFKDDNNLKKKCFDLLAIKFKDNNTIIDPINIYRMKYRKNSEIFNFPIEYKMQKFYHVK